MIPTRRTRVRNCGHFLVAVLAIAGSFTSLVGRNLRADELPDLAAAAARPASPEAAVREFVDEIYPLLQTRCVGCHGPDRQEGGLRLDVRRRALLGGDTDLAIRPGAGKSSELVRRLRTMDPKLRMPQSDEPLTGHEIARLECWINAGAPWPDHLAGREDASEHWSYRPLSRPAIPLDGEGDWVRTPIDAFVVSRWKDARLRPSEEADRRTLLRRLSLDLIGLPPEPSDVRAFVEDSRPDAYDRWVDRLLSSPQFGERWAKHWLDLVRFAESDGYENDNPRPHMWRYRDWVIQSINQDVPFDQFSTAQIAGDLLPGARPEDRIATAFHRHSLHNSAGGADAEEFRVKAAKDRAAVTGAVWMGLTMNCAECHSHKYDPVSHREYHRFYAFFDQMDHAHEGDVPTVRAASRITRIHKRGNFLDPGATVEPGVPGFLPDLTSTATTANRLDLACWLMSREHPLTARVAANHLWQHLFGEGLVPTPENFGRKGEKPTHPELLDWLSVSFMGAPGDVDDGIWLARRDRDAGRSALTNRQLPSVFGQSWSRKSLIRKIVASSVYRQSSTNTAQRLEVDPDNRLLSRQRRFRLEAEMLRDVALATSGLLDMTLGGASIQPQLPKGLSQLSELKNERFQESRGSPYRRGLYVHMQRTFPYPMFAAFDGPDGNVCTIMRDRSTTPLQALTLLNDPAMEECARALGRRLFESTSDDFERIRFGFELCLARLPDDTECAVLGELIDRQRRLGAGDEAVWFGVARSLLNLDQTMTRE